ALTVNPVSVSAPAGGATGVPVSVVAPAGCSWTAASLASWITIGSATPATGNGTVTLNVAANSGAARSGSVTIAGQPVTVSQPGNCTITVSPLTVDVAVAG